MRQMTDFGPCDFSGDDLVLGAMMPLLVAWFLVVLRRALSVGFFDAC
jgi:hypothetical protein